MRAADTLAGVLAVAGILALPFVCRMPVGDVIFAFIVAHLVNEVTGWANDDE